MKTAVIFYSLEGNTKLIAESIAKKANADLIELIPTKAYSTSPFLKYVWGGKSVVLHERPALQNGKIDFDSYDTLILGTPIWAGTYTPPFETLLKENTIKNKSIALFVCHAGGGANKCFQNMKNALPDNRFIGEIDFNDPLKKGAEESTKRAEEWVLTLKN